MRFEAQHGDAIHSVSVSRPREEDAFEVAVGDHQTQVKVLSTGPPWVLSVNGRVYQVRLDNARTLDWASGRTWGAQVQDPGCGLVQARLSGESAAQQHQSPAADSAGGGQLKSPIPGRVLRVLVGEGDVVQKGQAVLVIEAMKMENELFSPAAGLVTNLLVKPGQAVESQALLLTIEPNS